MATASSTRPESAVPLSQPRSSSRLPMFDAARLVAAAGIVWVHTVDWPFWLSSRNLGRFAVPFFVLAAVFFLVQGVRRDPQRPFGAYAISRFKRIYLPFLAWVVIYFAMRNAKHVLLNHQPPIKPQAYLLFTGGVYHLWFLPFILAVSVLFMPLAKAAIRHPAVHWPLALASVLGGLAIALTPRPQPWSDSPDTNLGSLNFMIGVVWTALPAAFWGLAIAILYDRIPQRMFRAAPVAIAGAALTAVCTAYLCMSDRSSVVENLAGIGWFLFALAPWSDRWIGRLGRLGLCSFGIYLAHGCFIEGTQAVAARAGLRASWALDLVVFALALGCSAVLTMALGRYRWSRWLVG